MHLFVHCGHHLENQLVTIKEQTNRVAKSVDGLQLRTLEARKKDPLLRIIAAVQSPQQSS